MYVSIAETPSTGRFAGWATGDGGPSERRVLRRAFTNRHGEYKGSWGIASIAGTFGLFLWTWRSNGWAFAMNALGEAVG